MSNEKIEAEILQDAVEEYREKLGGKKPTSVEAFKDGFKAGVAWAIQAAQDDDEDTDPDDDDQDDDVEDAEDVDDEPEAA